MSDGIVEYHGQQLIELCRRHGLGFSSEAGGPHVFPIDALRALGRTDIAMGEFWAPGPHRAGEDQRLFVKQTASAAHIYGKRFAAMEAFTSIGPHWEEDPWALKPVCDRAFLEGGNLFYLHTFTHSPPVAGKSGWEYFAGTHFNPNITWWKEARLWTDYIARSQYLLSQGLFVADVLYYYGDHVPNFVPRKETQPSLGLGYDYDVTDAEAILTRLSVTDGRVTLPDGMSYRLLVLPEREDISHAVLGWIGELVEAGATVAGRRPQRSTGLGGYPRQDRAVVELARKMWRECDGVRRTQSRYGKGRIVCGARLRDALSSAGCIPDFDYHSPQADAWVDYIHRRAGTTDIYFVVNQRDRWEDFEADFRAAGKQPEFWEQETGLVRRSPVYRTDPARTVVPMRLPPYGSVFVVFSGRPGGKAQVEVDQFTEAVEMAGSWQVSFQEGRGAPPSSLFEKLISWPEHADPGIKYFSGAATYRKRFEAPAGLKRAGRVLMLDLGGVKNIARVRVNGRDAGVAWKPPYRVDVTRALRPGVNEIEIEVTNLWPNRLIGDAFLPVEKRITRTNIHKFTEDSPLLPSGLLGPVRIVAGEKRAVE